MKSPRAAKCKSCGVLGSRSASVRPNQQKNGSLRSAKPDGAQCERGRGDCGCGSVECASPQGRADDRVAGRGPGSHSTRRGTNVLGPYGGAHPAWLASGTTRRTALSTFRSDSLLLLHGRPRSRAHWSGARSTPDATPRLILAGTHRPPNLQLALHPIRRKPATRRCTNTSCSSSSVSA